MFLSPKLMAHEEKLQVKVSSETSSSIIKLSLTPPPDHHYNIDAPGNIKLQPIQFAPSWKVTSDNRFQERVIKLDLTLTHDGTDEVKVGKLLLTISYYLCTDDFSNCFPSQDYIIELDISADKSAPSEQSISHQFAL